MEPSDWYSPSESLITPGIRTKSTRERKSKLPMMGDPDRDEDRYAFEPVDDRVRDGPATTQVAEAKAVVAVDRDPCVVESFHVILVRSPPAANSGRPVGAGIIHALRSVVATPENPAIRLILPYFDSSAPGPSKAHVQIVTGEDRRL